MAVRRRRAAGSLIAAAIVVAVAPIVWPWPHAKSAAVHHVAHAAQVARKDPPKPAASHAPAQSQLSALGLPNPKNRMLLGAFTGLSGQTSMEAAVEQREAAMGRHYDLEATFYNWPDHFPNQGEATMAAHGRIPLMTWYGPGASQGAPFALGEINNGQDDQLILRLARAMKDYGKPVWLQPMIEMNGTWYGGYSGNPPAFIAAWRRIHDLFARVGVTNVVWVWTVNISPHNWDSYYPGNAYVDVIGADAFNNPKWGGWQPFSQIFGDFLRHFAGRKPLLIGETATNTIAGGAGEWINGMHSYLKNVAGPRYGLVALCWFDTDTSPGAYNWRVDQSAAAWHAWLALARDPYFGGKG